MAYKKKRVVVRVQMGIYDMIAKPEDTGESPSWLKIDIQPLQKHGPWQIEVTKRTGPF